ncbi:XdhC/CoxI family protein [Saccharothrix sp. NPDC042600]|uniref:XdhC family protein n=1 Tax=Saccharothrix TaxID=2071 RepID=UPI0033E9EDB4|nr:XdhC family protein [Saccharothrix mutabilis subsp. capreolus]
MRELASLVSDWDGPYAVASVVAVRGSAPREVGAALAVHPDGRVVGSVSGGCVEGAVYELALSVLETGTPRLARFGYSAEDAFAVGLTCGGELEVFVQVVTPEIRSALRAARDGRPVVLTRSLDTGDGEVSFPPHAVSTSSVVDGRLVESWGTAPRLLVFGAIDYAAAVARQGKFLGYHVTVCDARPVFATPERFPAADEVVVDWPHRYLASTPVDASTAVCVLTHDPKFDVPLLKEALRLPVGFVGALGSRRTHLDRLARLRAEGVTEAQLARLRSPIGLDLGARTPEETAVSIAAEIIAVRRGGGGLPLTGADTPIHKEDPNGTDLPQRRRDAWRPAAPPAPGHAPVVCRA